MKKKKKYTVIGLYLDNTEARFADIVEATSPEKAEELVLNSDEQRGSTLVIAGVLEGDHQMVA